MVERVIDVLGQRGGQDVDLREPVDDGLFRRVGILGHLGVTDGGDLELGLVADVAGQDAQHQVADRLGRQRAELVGQIIIAGGDEERPLTPRVEPLAEDDLGLIDLVPLEHLAHDHVGGEGEVTLQVGHQDLDDALLSVVVDHHVRDVEVTDVARGGLGKADSEPLGVLGAAGDAVPGRRGKHRAGAVAQEPHANLVPVARALHGDHESRLHLRARARRYGGALGLVSRLELGRSESGARDAGAVALGADDQLCRRSRRGRGLGRVTHRRLLSMPLAR